MAWVKEVERMLFVTGPVQELAPALLDGDLPAWRTGLGILRGRLAKTFTRGENPWTLASCLSAQELGPGLGHSLAPGPNRWIGTLGSQMAGATWPQKLSFPLGNPPPRGLCLKALDKAPPPGGSPGGF